MPCGEIKERNAQRGSRDVDVRVGVLVLVLVLVRFRLVISTLSRTKEDRQAAIVDEPQCLIVLTSTAPRSL